MPFWPMSDAARDQLVSSHTMDARAVVESPTFGTRKLPILGGSVEVDTGSQVRRIATIVTDPSLWPTNPQDLLAPFGTTCRIERGIVIPGVPEPEWVPLGLFSLDKTGRTRSADTISAVTLKLVDLSQRVAEDRFEAPTQTLSGATVISEITRFIQDVLGATWPVIDLTGSTQVCPVLDIARERWSDGIEKLADSIAAEVFFDQIGQAVIRPQPTIGDAPVWYARTGRGGNVLTTDEEWNRDNVWNRWVVSGQRADGTNPVTATVSDDDPSSPTWVGGPFGVKTRYLTTPLATTVPQCTAIGQAMIERFRGLACKVNFDLIVNPALDGGDVVEFDDVALGRAAHIIDKLSIPLTPTDSLSVNTRSDLVLPSES